MDIDAFCQLLVLLTKSSIRGNLVGGEAQDHLDLFIEPQRGLTRELLYHAKNRHALNPPVLFSRPHRKSIPMDDCENILMVANAVAL